MAKGKTAAILVYEQDRYERDIADVYYGDTWVNLELVREDTA